MGPHHIQADQARRAASSTLTLVLAVVLTLGAVGALAPADAAAPAARDLKCFGVAATIVGTPGDDVIRGTNGDDVIVGGRGDDRINGRGGDDLICGRSGDDTIRGGSGDDRVRGWRGDDVIKGGAGDDRLLGGLQADKLLGGSGDDILNGGPASDECDGGPGANHLVACEVTPNEAPTDLTLAPTSVSENRPGGTAVGTLSAADPDAGDTHTFTLVAGTGSADNGSFTIVGATLRTAVSLDFETTPTQSVRVRATDAGGLSVERALTVTVTDVDDPPVAVDDTRTVVEDAAATAIDVLANDTDSDGGPKSVASVTQPAHGTVVVTGGGTGLTYAPHADYCNTPTPPFDTFTYTLNGGDVGAVAVTVTCVDDDPVAVDDNRTVAEDAGATAVDVLANDTDVDAGPKSIQSVTQPTHGTVVITGGGTGLTYAPAASYCNDGSPTDNFNYSLTPGGSTATVHVTVTCVDDPPAAVDDSASTTEDAAVAPVPVLTNDTDIDGGPKTIQSTTQPVHGTVAIIGGGAGLTYAPEANYCNTPPGTTPDTFTYTLNGGSSATVSMSVTCVDDDPTAVDDAATVGEDAAATAVDVLANDTDVDGGPKSIGSVVQPANGTVVITGGGTGVTYVPDANYCNTPPGTTPDTFTYTLNGGSTATVSVTVTCADDSPAAVDDSATVDEDAAATAVDVLANDTDTDGGPRSIGSVVQPVNGTVVITGGGTGLTYVPDADYCNSPPGTTLDTFTYALSPGGSSATVSVTVTCVDDPPVAVDDAATVVLDAPATAVDVLANDTDIDGGPRSIGSVVQPADGTVVITGGGTGLTYEPDPGYCNDGSPFDTFTYTLNGGSSATVRMTVTCDTAPTAVDDSATVNEDSGANAVAVLANDTDPDGGPKSVGSVTQPANGAVVITGGGTGLTYAPNANYCNSPPGTTPDTFTYTLSPGTSTATVSVTVTCVDDDPAAVDDAATVNEDSGANALDVLANDTDIDGGPRSVTSVVQPANGAVLITGGGSGLSYAPSANYCNNPPGTTPDTFGYTLNGGSSATVSVTVTCVNDAPSVAPESFDAIGNTGLFVGTTRPATQAGKEITGSVLTNDTDPDSPPASLVVEPVTNAPTTLGGTITIEADGNFTYHPDDGDTGVTDTFVYRVCDDTPCTAATDANATGTLSLPIAGQVWYVRNNEPAGGDGTSDTPFDTLAEAEAASGTGDTVYVFDGANTTTNLDTGYAMNANEELIGESRPLAVDPDGGAPLPTSPLFPGTSGAQPTLTASNEDVVVLASNALVDGVDIDPSGTGGGISGGVGTAAVTVRNVNVTDTGTAGTQPGIELDSTTGVNQFTSVTVTNGGSATAIGVRLFNAGTVNFSAAGTISIATTGAKALDATGTNMGTGSVFDDITVTGSGTGGVNLVNTTGATTLGNGAGTDLDLTTTSGATAALNISNGGTVSVPGGGTANLNATGGPAADITGTSGATFDLDTVSSTGSANDGVNLSGLGTGTFTATGGAIGGAAGIAFDLDGGSGTVTYPGTFNNGSGSTADITTRSGGVVSFGGNINDTNDAGGGITLSGNSGGSTTFSGATKTINSGAGDAITMTSSDGHTLNLTGGGLDLDATSGRGLRADTSGTITVTGSGNTIDTTTGIALDVTNTDIGNNDVTFQRVASNGATSGIVLNTTGNANGALVVTGNGGTCSSAATCTGGAIQASTGPGLNLTSVPGGASLTRVAVTAGGDDGIRATTVNDIDLADSVVLNNGNSHTGGLEERGLDYLNVTGTPEILRTVVSGSDDSNAHIRNTVAGTTTLGVNNSTFSDSKFNAGLRLRGEGSSVMNATVQNSTFSLNADPGFSMQNDASNTAQQTLLLTANSFSGGSSNAVSGRPQVSINADSSSVVKATISNNQIKSAAGAEIIVNTLASQTAAGSLDAKVIGNTINDAQPGALDALADGGTSIWGWAHGDGATRIEVRNNVVANYGGRAMELSHNDGNGTADFTVTGNTFSTPDVTPNTFEGMYILSGGAGGDASNVCVDLENNDFDGIGRQGVSDIAIDRFSGTQLRFADFNDTSVPNLQNNLRGKNPASPGLTVETFSNGPTATAATSCTLTSGTP
jgi:VCBS repeat-containing protein